MRGHNNKKNGLFFVVVVDWSIIDVLANNKKTETPHYNKKQAVFVSCHKNKQAVFYLVLQKKHGVFYTVLEKTRNDFTRQQQKNRNPPLQQKTGCFCIMS